jgi:hypothetical protein
MVGRASALLALTLRAAALVALTAALAGYYSASEEFPELSSWGDVVVLSFLLLGGGGLINGFTLSATLSTQTCIGGGVRPLGPRRT